MLTVRRGDAATFELLFTCSKLASSDGLFQVPDRVRCTELFDLTWTTSFISIDAVRSSTSKIF